MSEGKFKEYIHALELTSMHGMNAEALRGLVDESAKEFPTENPELYKEHFARGDYTYPYRIWFKRWFGEQK